MSANFVTFRHNQENVLFHCPLTGLPICGDVEQAFEGEISPYLLFAITTTGEVFLRSDSLREPLDGQLQSAMDRLAEEIHRPDAGLSIETLETFLSSAITHLLPDSAVVFEVCTTAADLRSSETFWVGMDFMLPETPARMEHVASVIRPE